MMFSHYAVLAKLELDILVSCPFCNLFVTSSENQNILGMDDSESTVAVSGLLSSALRLVSKSQTTIQSQRSTYVMFRKEKARKDAKTNREKYKEYVRLSGD